jgi:putative acetyltransferase
MEILLRNEEERDYRRVEELTREAFWNLYVPGCNEHYLVHVMRSHRDFIGSLDFVAIVDGEIVGNIMYTRSWLADESGARMDILTFGPVSVLPAYQGKGIGSRLITHTLAVARDRGEKAIAIYGHPRNYCRHGFRNGKDLGVSDREGRYPYGLLVLELAEGALKGHAWKYHDSELFHGLGAEDAEAYDGGFPAKEKGYRHTQEEFSIACRAFLE